MKQYILTIKSFISRPLIFNRMVLKLLKSRFLTAYWKDRAHSLLLNLSAQTQHMSKKVNERFRVNYFLMVRTLSNELHFESNDKDHLKDFIRFVWFHQLYDFLWYLKELLLQDLIIVVIFNKSLLVTLKIKYHILHLW